MIEDIMDYDGSNGLYKQQAPLRLPPLPPTSVSPRFDNAMTQSNPVPWSPAQLDRNPYEKPANVDSSATNHALTRSTELWTHNNNNHHHNNNIHPYTKSSDSWMNNNNNNNNNMNYNNNIHSYTKSSDAWINNNNNIHTKSDVWTNHQTQSKTSEIWVPNNGITKTTDSTIFSNNSSNVPMISSAEKKSWCSKDTCSSRCKLGILGFIIGFLTVSIALAVVLVLWLRQ